MVVIVARHRGRGRLVADAAPRGGARREDRHTMQHADIVSKMTLEEKAAYVSGRGAWHTKAVPRLGVDEVELTDGPHGLRKLAPGAKGGEFTNLVRTTAFPTASLSACSFDPELLREMGGAIADECLEHGVAMVLGPGANLKRSPLCGRNFEYFSEDPLLSARMAASWIRGAEGKGVATSLKHYADDVSEVKAGTECGLSLESYSDIKEGDVLECYVMTEVAKKLQ